MYMTIVEEDITDVLKVSVLLMVMHIYDPVYYLWFYQIHMISLYYMT